MLEKLLEWDRELFLFLNGKHSDWLDPIMLFLSSYIGWILGFLFMAAFIYFKAEVWKRTGVFFFFLSTGLSGLLTNIIKLFIERPRPIHNELWLNTIHAIEKHSNSFSFFSSHSATTFTMAIFFLLFFRKEKLYGVIAVAWATTVAYSRIYVAKHYPFDVLVGILFGIMIGFLGYKLFQNFKKKKEMLKP